MPPHDIKDNEGEMTAAFHEWEDGYMLLQYPLSLHGFLTPEMQQIQTTDETEASHCSASIEGYSSAILEPSLSSIRHGNIPRLPNKASFAHQQLFSVRRGEGGAEQLRSHFDRQARVLWPLPPA